MDLGGGKIQEASHSEPRDFFRWGSNILGMEIEVGKVSQDQGENPGRRWGWDDERVLGLLPYKGQTRLNSDQT